MALILCGECGKGISDKAIACPSCGCPQNDTIKSIQDQTINEEYLLVKCVNCGKSIKANASQIIKELNGHATFKAGGCSCGNTMYFKIENDSVYQSIIQNEFVIVKCLKCKKNLTMKESQVSIKHDGHPIINGGGCSCGNSLHFEIVNESKRFDAGNNQNRIDIPEIPVGLYMTTAILGFPLGTGIALGGYFGAKRFIGKGDYDKARKHIKSIKSICWVIVVFCAIVLVIILSMFTSMQ